MSFCKRKAVSFTAALLSAVTLSTSLVSAEFDSAFSYHYQIADTAQYTRLEGKNTAGLQKASYIEYTPGSNVSPMIVYAGSSLYGSKATITDAGNYLKNQGYHVIGGINADFFVLGTSIPIGLVIKDGELISSDAWQYAVGFRADGSAVIGQPSSSMKIEGPSGAVFISYFNKTRTKSGIYLLDSNYSSQTHISTNGSSIVLERVDDTPVKINGQVKLRVVAKGSGNSSTTITDNQMVLTVDANCQATWVDFPVGEEVTLTIGTPDMQWGDVVYAVGGKSLVSSGNVSASGIDGGGSNSPRTAVGVNDNGQVILYEIDGRQSSISAGLTATQLGNELKSMGYNNVICLDGGGSSAMTVRIPGEEGGAQLVTSPSDGALRACANYIFLVNKAAPDGVARHLHMRPSQYYLLPGASTYFKVWASDSAYEPAPLPAGVTYTASSGTVNDAEQIYTAGDTTESVTVTGTSTDGAITGKHNFCVTQDVNKIELQSADKTVTSFSLRGGQSMDVDAKAYHQNQLMASKDSLMQWTVTGDIGSVDAEGIFTAGEKPASGKLTCSYGATTASVNITVGLSDPQQLTTVADFDTVQPLTGSADLTLTQTTQMPQVFRGNGALAVTYSAEGDRMLSVPRTVTDQLSVLSLWTMADHSGTELAAVFEDTSGAELVIPLGEVTNGSYTQLHTEIPENAAALTGIRILKDGTGTLYLDHILMSQHLVNNTDAPDLNMTQAPTKVEENTSATVSARITMENGSYVMRPSNVTAYIDGVKAASVYDPASGSISVQTGALSAGQHQVTIEAIDDAGNRTRKTVSITAGSSTSSQFTDTASNWANGYINFAAARGLIEGESKNGQKLFYPQRNLRRMEFAVIMARYLKLDTSHAEDLPFSDADDIPDWAAGAVNACNQAGIMNGQLNTHTNRNEFNPNANITRAEVMTVISKSLPRGYVTSTTQFSDFNSIAEWALPHIRYTVAAGVIDGYEDGSIRPNHNITRAEIAKVLCSLY